jgi:hypothetical protein
VVQFLFKLTYGKPVGYYAQHIKNLAIFGAFPQTEAINRLLGICNTIRVDNLVLLVSPRNNWKFDFLDNPLAGWIRVRVDATELPPPVR